jgi:predicted DNA-binding antitoxin AbrB/MazE fold protein
MAFEVEATYENGVLRPDQPLPLREHERVTVSVKSSVDCVRDSYGSVPTPSDLGALDYLTNSPENSPWEGT